jgi:hypothetical protein
VKPWRVQKFVGDVIYDLRSRNLLPVVLMLLVGIVAVPVLVSSSSSSTTTLGVGAQASALTSPHNENAVVAYHPGVRNYKQRLRDLSAKDPFKQQFATSAATTGTTLDQVTSSSSTGVPQSTSVSGGSGGGGGGGGTTKTKTKTKTETRYTYYATDVAVGESGGGLTQLNNISQFQFLPSPDKPVLVYLGTSSGGTQALFLVSKDVSSVGGNGTCFPTADACQLLGLNQGSGADLIYAVDGKTYHLQVTKIKRVTSSKPPV